MDRLGYSERPDWPLAVIVGAGGMGMAVARRLSQRHRVLLADLDAGRAEVGAETLRAEGGDARGIACDVTDPRAVSALGEAADRLGGFRALVHVAGLSPSMADFRTIVRVNLTGATAVAETFLPRAGAGAAAILIASIAGHAWRPPREAEPLLRELADPALADRLADALGEPQATPQQAYGMSKHGLIAYCRRRAAAWGERGARIVSLSPGMIATPMGALEFERSPAKQQLFQRTPLRREGAILEIADAVEFLASDRASFITGTDLLVDGGLAAAMSEG